MSPPPSITDAVRIQNMNAFLTQGPPGCVVEVGVYRGGSLHAFAVENPGRHCYGYDTFDGLPEPGAKDNEAQRGMFRADFDEVREIFKALPNVSLVRGHYPASDAIRPFPVALAHVDVDLYGSTLEACEWLAPRMARGGRIYCDDAGVPACEGATLAFVEFAVTWRRLVSFDRGSHWYVQF